MPDACIPPDSLRGVSYHWLRNGERDALFEWDNSRHPPAWWRVENPDAGACSPSAMADLGWVYYSPVIPPMPKTAGDAEQICTLPNGNLLYCASNGVGGHTYYSDEIGGGVMVWDTCLTDRSTLLAAIVAEEARVRAETIRQLTLARTTREKPK